MKPQPQPDDRLHVSSEDLAALDRQQHILSEATPILQTSARPTLKELLLAETPRAEIPVPPRRRP